MYIRTSPTISFSRILQRARSEERKIDFAFLKTLHDLHEIWLLLVNQHAPTPVSKTRKKN